MFFIIAFVICGTSAYASPVCAKQYTFIGSLDKSLDGDTTATNENLKAWRVDYDYDGDSSNGAERIITGLAACNGISAASVGTANTGLFTDSTDVGVYCWCKMEPVYDPVSNDNLNGLGTTMVTGITSYWVYAYDYATANSGATLANQENACATQCTPRCAQLMKDNTGNFRANLFESIW